MQRKLKNNYHILALIFIGVFSFILNFYAISQNGTGNEYYAAAIKSMTQSFHNFFFVSFDPSGLVSVDKPPLGLWTQAIFVLIFGYHGWAMLLPQALAGTASCLMIYFLTAKYFGKPAGLISAFLFSLTPAVVVVSRNNTMDMQLIFVMLVAAWFLFKAIDSGKWRFLFYAAVFVGLGFNIKMLQAYMILPSIAIVYLIFAKEKFVKRLIAGLISIAIMLAISLSWVLVVELVPAANRPYVDSTSGNSMMELIFGHNGTERLFGSSGGGGMDGGAMFDRNGRPGFDSANGLEQQDGTQNNDSNRTQQAANQNGTQDGTPSQIPENGRWGKGRTVPDGMRSDGGNMGGGIGGSEIGNASATRLWSANLYGQGSWLLLFAILSIFGCINITALKKKEASQASLLFWAVWLAVMVGFFSFAGFYHRYYLCMLAPGIAVLGGVGIVTMYRGLIRKHESRKEYIRPVFLLVGLITNIVLEGIYIFSYEAIRVWMLPVMGIFGAIGLILFSYSMFKSQKAVLILAVAALTASALTAPLYWSLTPVMHVPNATMPYAGPELSGNGQNRMAADSTGGQRGTASGLEEYLVNNYKQGSFLVVSQRSSDVAQFIIDTNLPCYAYGGFLGSDNSLTLAKLKEYVAAGKITYFLVSSQNGGGNSEIISYVKENATLIDSSEYSGGNSSGNRIGGQNEALYCFGS